MSRSKIKNPIAVRHYIRHDPSTGQIFAKVARRGCPEGTELGTIQTTGHVKYNLFGVDYQRAHIIVFFELGKFPRQVTRRNGVPHDDRFENLRLHW